MQRLSDVVCRIPLLGSKIEQDTLMNAMKNITIILVEANTCVGGRMATFIDIYQTARKCSPPQMKKPRNII